jgi:DNA polymerase III epsilon subunit-like protein
MRSDRARETAIRHAKEWVQRRPIYLDTETTGLNNKAQIVEIAVIDADGGLLYQALVRPTVPIPPDANRIHGINDEMVRSAPFWPEVFGEVQSAIRGRGIAIYNAEYDLRLMKQSHQAHRMPWRLEARDTLCVMELYARYYGQWDSRKGGYRWHSLEAAGRQCGIQLPNTHRAQDDAMLARAVLHHIAQAEA